MDARPLLTFLKIKQKLTVSRKADGFEIANAVRKCSYLTFNLYQLLDCDNEQGSHVFLLDTPKGRLSDAEQDLLPHNYGYLLQLFQDQPKTCHQIRMSLY
ncbi:hypothetical protein Pint_34402 [Pistacia integerrima]|uniref:Uncharacterized protein n=1 Tax=Pistacia integerrima TaxID=434235 RepID=A0ACC0X6S4_9ROSI|nr:hypothetical protein Pint_34402 [Pistacia integerrima]